MTKGQVPAVVIEITRHGRRPRYHVGAQVGRGVYAVPEACNTDQAGAKRQLDRLPALRRPWTQLCRRCWRDTAELREALAYRAVRIKAAAKATIAGPPATL